MIPGKHREQIQLSDHFDTRRLLRFALPSICMMIFTSVYGVVDGYFVSNFVGKTPFAAVNLIMPYLMILGALGFILGTGGSALIGKLLGQGRREDANDLFSMLVYVTLIAGVVIALLGQAALRRVAIALGADASMLEGCVAYGRIVLWGIPAYLLQYEFQSFFVTAERPKLGLWVTVASGVMNMVLDALLVGALGMGIPGAAIATVMSAVVGGAVPLFYFARPNTSLLRLGRARFDGRSLARTLSNGASEFVSSISMSVVSMLYNAQLMVYAGENGVAAYGVLMYVCMIFLAVFLGFSASTAPIVSFHYGAGDTRELHSLLLRGLRVVGIVSVAMLALSEALALPLSRLFVGYDAALMALTLRAFRVFSFSFLLCGFPIFGSSFFTALNDGLTSAAISFLRTMVFQVASVLLLPGLLGLDGIWLSLIAAELAAAAVTAGMLIWKRSKYNY